VRDRLAREPRAAAVYASPLRRALSVASLLEEAGVGPLVEEPALREIGCGRVDGLPVEEVRARFPALWEANERQDDDGFRWPGGESYAELRARCVAAVDRIARSHPGARVVVVTHAGVVAQLVGASRGTPAARWSEHRPGNGSLTTIDWLCGGGRVVRFDDRDHLRGAALRAS
jgi:alpha-ribazole phosphatase/probable phosphoglycerate mutase